LLTNDVIMKGDDVDLRLALGAKNSLNLLSGRDEVAIDDGVLGAARPAGSCRAVKTPMTEGINTSSISVKP